MKKIYGFAFASAIMALASCSNDSEPVVDQPVVDGGSKYLNVTIANAGGTRADEFENGSGNENNITKLDFVVLQNDVVKYVKTVDPTSDEWTGFQGPGNFPNTVEMIGGTTLIIPNNVLGTTNDGADGTTAVPSNLKLLVLCNYPDTDIVPGTTEKSDLEAKMLAVAANQSSFVMSNSAYFKSNASDADVIREVEIDHTYLVNTKEEALNMPLDVYVERIAARIDLSAPQKTVDNVTSVDYAANGFLNDNTLVWQNKAGQTKTLTPEIIGFAYYGDPTQTNLLKNTSNWTSGWFNGGVNNANYHRSYWATTPDFTPTGVAFPSSTTAWTGASKEYLNENTNGLATPNKATKVVVMAVLKDQDGKVQEMANVFGQFTDKAGAGALIANTLKGLGYWVVSADGKSARTIEYGDDKDLKFSGKALAGDAFAVGEGKGNRTYLEVKEAATGFRYATIESIKADGSFVWKDVTAADINKLLKSETYAVSFWNGGRTYYYTDINHINFSADASAVIPGVVRNHIYKVAINSIYGFGTPVFDPDTLIVPTEPEYNDDNKVNLAATINVLNWHVVSNSVDFNKPTPTPEPSPAD